MTKYTRNPSNNMNLTYVKQQNKSKERPPLVPPGTSYTINYIENRTQSGGIHLSSFFSVFSQINKWK